MALIDVHAHYALGDITPEQTELLMEQEGFSGTTPDTAWSPEIAIRMMDARGIDMQLLSLPIPLDAAHVRAANATGAQIVAANPGRFGLLAGLPLGEPAAAAVEIGRAFDELGADGIAVMSNYAGVYLGNPVFEPVLAELDRRAAVVFVHPTTPPGFRGLSLGRPGPLIEYPMDTTRTAVDLLFAGVLVRYPRIQFVLAHAGGALPALAERIRLLGTKNWVANPRGITAEQLRDQAAALYVDTAIAGSAVLDGARKMLESGHVLYGSDFPPAGLDVIDAVHAELGVELGQLEGAAASLFPAAAARIK